jgi:putative IMPACT (imprinted ancient) family translation regulator
MDADSFLTLAGEGVAQTRVKGSTFFALAAPAADEAEARARLAAREREMWDATHHCNAWRMRGGTHRANDAGSPPAAPARRSWPPSTGRG